MKSNSKLNLDMQQPRTLKDTRKARLTETEEYRTIMRDGIAALEIPGKVRRILEAMIGDRPYSGPLLGSDIAARAELQSQLIQLVDALQRQNPKLRFFFLTMLSDEYRTRKREPVLFLRKLRRKSDKAIRMLVKDFQLVGAVGMIEAAFVMNPPDTGKPEYAFHTHAVCWADDSFDFKAAKKAVESLGNWTHGWGIPPIRLRELTEKQGVAAWWARYIAKHPLKATNVVQRADGNVEVYSVRKWRFDARLRLLEGLSQCRLPELIFGVADGKFIRDPVLRRTKAARKLAHPILKKVTIDSIPRVWRKVWATSPAHHEKPWLMIE